MLKFFGARLNELDFSKSRFLKGGVAGRGDLVIKILRTEFRGRGVALAQLVCLTFKLMRDFFF